MEKENQTFDYNEIPLGFYDEIANQKRGIRSFWHNHKFDRIIDSFSPNSGSILDIGCFCGTFLKMIGSHLYQKQVGVDILESQIHYANQHYKTDFRQFIFLKSIADYETLLENESFDCITVIEVIEHLRSEEIADLLHLAYKKLKPQGKLILTTPNYFSIWPLLEIFLNAISKVKYQDQHISKFTYTNFEKKLRDIFPPLDSTFKVAIKTTSHCITPFIAIISYRLAHRISKMIPHKKWGNPLGAIIIAELQKI